MLPGLEKQPFKDVIKGSRITLVHANPSFTSQVWAYIQRDHALGGINYRWVESEQDVAKHITADIPRDPKAINYLILKNEIAIGSFHIHTITYSDYKAEIGYGIEKGEEGKGYVSEALQLVEAEMKRLGFNKLIINCDSNNLRSIKVAERNGFRHEGTLLQDCVENDKFRDSVVFGKLLRQQ
jgi:RimJ/RimL family protein N-acetyltransferase